MSTPRVTAHYERHPVKRICGDQSTGVTVTVEFTLGDHDHALRQLEDAVADVLVQIEETRS